MFTGVSGWERSTLFLLTLLASGRLICIVNQGRTELVRGKLVIRRTKPYTKSISAVLDEDVPDPAVLLEELLDVPLTDVVRQVAQKNSAPFSGRHLLRDRASNRSSVFLKSNGMSTIKVDRAQSFRALS